MVQEGEILMIDSSSTTLRIVPHLAGKSNLTAITNGAKTAIELGELGTVQVHCTGGKLRENSLSYVGQSAQRFVESYHVDIVFFSCRALHMVKGFYDANEDEAELRRVMVRNARKAVLLCDQTKFDKASFCKIGNFDILDTVVTDQAPRDDWATFLKTNAVELIHP